MVGLEDLIEGCPMGLPGSSQAGPVFNTTLPPHTPGPLPSLYTSPHLRPPGLCPHAWNGLPLHLCLLAFFRTRQLLAPPPQIVPHLLWVLGTPGDLPGVSPPKGISMRARRVFLPWFAHTVLSWGYSKCLINACCSPSFSGTPGSIQGSVQ